MVSGPVILVVDDREGPLTVRAELEARYGTDYAIVVEPTIERGATRLGTLAHEQAEVALVLASWAEGGTEFLGSVREQFPLSRRGLLIDWGQDRSERERLIQVVALGQADYWIGRPVLKPDERFHRSVTEFLDEFWRIHGIAFEVLRIVGEPRSPRSHEMRDLLQRHDVPYGFYAPTSPEGQAILAEVGTDGSILPVVVSQDGSVLLDPSNVEIADALGARTQPGEGIYDVLVVGGGPAGLAAAVYGGSEGLRTGLVEATAMGGQAGTSSLIRNYLGFPRGISGAELATRAFEQAILFGTEMIYGATATSLRQEGDIHVVTLADGRDLPARSVVIATGVAYRMLDVPALDPYVGAGVFYGAGMSEAQSLAGQPVCVVGGGNSAGQAAMYLARYADRVTILVRSDSLAESMSEYLISDIEAAANVDVRFGAEVVGAGGDSSLSQVVVRDRPTGGEEAMPAAGLFVLIGAQPFTTWLPDAVLRDRWGYLMTGRDTDRPDARVLETSVPGVFAVGDVRHTSVKRVAAAAGEGAMAIRFIHEHLDEVADAGR
jgi:thioredoxin reductase (NADPH)